jgi:hypothetical protein
MRKALFIRFSRKLNHWDIVKRYCTNFNELL